MRAHKSRSMSKRTAFIRAKAMHEDNGKPAYVLYDHHEKSYFAATAYELDDRNSHYIGSVGGDDERAQYEIEAFQKIWGEVIDSRCVCPELMDRFMAELKEVGNCT